VIATPTPPRPVDGPAPTPRFTLDPDPPASEAVYLRKDPADASVTDVMLVRSDGQERLLRRVSTGVLGTEYLGPYGSVADNGWIAIGTASADPALAAYRLLDLADPGRAPVEVSYPAVIGGRWSVDGLFARSSLQDRSSTGWMRIAVLDPRTGVDVELGRINLFGGGPSIVWAADGSGILDGGRLRPADASPNVLIHPDLTFSDPRVGAGGNAIGIVCPGEYGCSRDTGGSVQFLELGTGSTSTWTLDLDAGEVPTSALFGRDGRRLFVTLDRADTRHQAITIARLDGPNASLERLVTFDAPFGALSTNGYQPTLASVSPDDRMFLIGYWTGPASNPSAHSALISLSDGNLWEVAGSLAGFLPEPLAESLPGVSP
jgi:hypothetical protein